MPSRLSRASLLGVGLAVGASLLAAPERASSDTFAKPPTAATATAASPLMMSSNQQCHGLRDLMVDTLVHQMVVGYGYGGYYGYHHGYYPAADMSAPGRAMPKSEAAPAAPTATGAASGGGQPMVSQPGPSHYTKTNTQERGVDEADIVKTDGRHVYTVYNNQLVIAKTWPVAKTDVAARVTFKTIQPQQLYLRGNEVIVQGYATEAANGWNNGRTRVMVVDVTNRSEPRIKRIFDVEGWSTNSRMVGDDLYLVQQSHVQMPQKLTELAQKTMQKIPRADQHTLRPWEVQARLAGTLRNTLMSNITRADIEAGLPKIAVAGSTRRMSCGDLYIPPNNIQMGMTTLARVSVTGSRADLVGAMVAGGQVYASTSALYVAAPHYDWNRYGYANYGTQIHKFALGDAQTRPSYIASGKVEGNILNQFSMSEHNGDLRVATTDWNWTGEQGGNNIFVMRPEGRRLAVIGSIRGLAKGERIYAGRMFGDKGYLVTFRQTDPLFTLDLSNPRNPRVVGELKIPGFSSYIHPMGGDQLLTIGQDATDQGRVTGLHLQIFDVSNPAKPRRTFHEKLSLEGNYSHSVAQHDHHAFMYDPITRTLAFPMTEYKPNGEHFNGLMVYKVDAKRGFQKKGRLDHRALANVWVEQTCRDQKKANPNYAHYYCTPEYKRQAAAQYPVTRSMIVDKYILSLSQIGLEIHELSDLDVAATLSWAAVEKHSATIAN